MRDQGDLKCLGVRDISVSPSKVSAVSRSSTLEYHSNCSNYHTWKPAIRQYRRLSFTMTVVTLLSLITALIKKKFPDNQQTILIDEKPLYDNCVSG